MVVIPSFLFLSLAHFSSTHMNFSLFLIFFLANLLKKDESRFSLISPLLWHITPPPLSPSLLLSRSPFRALSFSLSLFLSVSFISLHLSLPVCLSLSRLLLSLFSSQQPVPAVGYQILSHAWDLSLFGTSKQERQKKKEVKMCPPW